MLIARTIGIMNVWSPTYNKNLHNRLQVKKQNATATSQSLDVFHTRKHSLRVKINDQDPCNIHHKILNLCLEIFVPTNILHHSQSLQKLSMLINR